VTARQRVLSQLAEYVVAGSTRRPAIVAIDGIDAAGKSSLSDELALLLGERGAEVVQVSIDGFHNPAGVRYARAGVDPALSYYEDSFDYAAFRTGVLDPIRRHEPRMITPRVFDHVSDSAVPAKAVEVGDAAIVLVDGIFLGRPELAGSWDLWVYLHVEQAVARERGVERDRDLYGDETLDRYMTRYEPGQALYLKAVDPMTHADVVVDNTNYDEPKLLGLNPR